VAHRAGSGPRALEGCGGSPPHFGLELAPTPHTLRGVWVAAVRTAGEGPRRAMIRRRGKRGRIRRAEAAEAYENRTVMTNDAPGISKECLGTMTIQPISPTRRDSGIRPDLG
jgi:hypothetical protein